MIQRHFFWGCAPGHRSTDWPDVYVYTFTFPPPGPACSNLTTVQWFWEEIMWYFAVCVCTFEGWFAHSIAAVVGKGYLRWAWDHWDFALWQPQRRRQRRWSGISPGMPDLKSCLHFEYVWNSTKTFFVKSWKISEGLYWNIWSAEELLKHTD